MIYQLRKKFIKICMLSFVAAFLVLFASVFLITYLQINASLDRLADVIAENSGKFPEFNEANPDFQERPPFWTDSLDRESPFTTRFFAVHFDTSGNIIASDTGSIARISQTEAEAYGGMVIQTERERGWLEGFRYKQYQSEKGRSVIFIDGAAARNNNQRLLISAASVFFAGSIVVLVLIVLTSKRAVKPAAESYERQKQFVTDVNHELKTPLTLVRTNLDIAEAEMGKNEWLEDIREESEKMTELVGRLVTLARMDEERTALEFLPFDLSEAVSDTISAFSSLSEQHGVTLTVHVPPSVEYKGDEAAIRQVISILMDNAVKYCDAGGEIAVALRNGLGRPPTLTVDNTFRAVTQIQFSRLFDRFYRADKARTYGGGFGIGLSIARSIMEKHKGTILAKSAGPDAIRFLVRF